MSSQHWENEMAVSSYDCLDPGGRAPTVGTLSDAGSIAEQITTPNVAPKPNYDGLPSGKSILQFTRRTVVIKPINGSLKI
jgi:ribosomal protein S30